MSVLTSDDDFTSPLIHGSGKFRKFDPSGDESSIPSLADPQNDERPTDRVKLGCFTVKRAVRHEVIVIVLMLAVILFGAGNSVSSRIKGQAMGHFNFFASLGNAVIYVILYFMILFCRRFLGLTPSDDITYPWRRKPDKIVSPFKSMLIGAREVSQEEYEDMEFKTGIMAAIKRIWLRIPVFKFFLVMGLMDGLGNILGLIAQPYLSGQLASIMTQAIVAYSMICAITILGTRYSYWQVWSMFVILGGTMVCLFANGLEGSTGTTSHASGQIGYSMIMLVSTLPNAFSFTLKELVFRKKPKLDIFVVNSNSSLFQLLLWPIFLPLTLLFNQTGGMPFGQYLKDGMLCFVGKYQFPENSPYSCASMPYPFLVYIAFNLAFNIALLLLLKQASALQAFMALKAVLPVSFLLFYFKWPLISASPINIFILIGLILVLAGLILYRLASISKELRSHNHYYASCLAVRLSLTSPLSSPVSSSINT